MAPPALYVQDPEERTRRILPAKQNASSSMFRDQLGKVNARAIRWIQTRQEALLKLSEVPLSCATSLIDLHQNRTCSQPIARSGHPHPQQRCNRCASTMKNSWPHRGVHPPFANSWEQLQEKRLRKRYSFVSKRAATCLPQRAAWN